VESTAAAVEGRAAPAMEASARVTAATEPARRRRARRGNADNQSQQGQPERKTDARHDRNLRL
jgi:hypothetical protein